ncbi:MAG: glutamyl-tRNA reductase [Planctomycetota bacterium]|jgi:glutamyl-tRNA reductase
MKILVAGLNHKSAPIDIREGLAFNCSQVTAALKQLKDRFKDTEFAIISTCNRVELYCVNETDREPFADDLFQFFSEFHNIPLEKFKDCLYVHEDDSAVEHLLTVASSLDSLVIGEAQIIGQVKESYRLACAAKSTGKVLNRLFHCAFTTGKKVHTSTSVATGRVSIAGVAVELALQLFADISAAKVIVIGAGEMGELLVQHLLQVKCNNITVINRSYNRALDIAGKYDISANNWEELNDQLVDADIVIASASVQDYLFEKDTFKNIMNNRHKGSLLVIDIAVPRNFEPLVNEIEDVYLYSIDDLSEVVQQNLKVREEDIAKGMQIVFENVTEFMEWFNARDIGPLIGQMRKEFGEISRKELEKFFVGTREEASCKESMEIMVNRLVNRLLHCVIENVNKVAKEQGSTEAARLIHSIVKQAREVSEATDKKEEQ